MLNSYGLSIPKLPGFDMGEWLRDQANIVQNLAQRANRVSPPQSMDQLQTMPFEVEDIWLKKTGPLPNSVFYSCASPYSKQAIPLLTSGICKGMQLGFEQLSHHSTCDFPILFALQLSALTRMRCRIPNMVQMSIMMKMKMAS